MPKNVTISVSDELAKRMEQYLDVNWSEVGRRAFDEYIKARESVEKGEVQERLEEYLRSKLPSPDTQVARKVEIERFTRKWGKPDLVYPDDSPSAKPPYVSLRKEIEVKLKDTFLTTLQVHSGTGIWIKPEEMVEFNAEKWKNHNYGQMVHIVDGFKSQGFTIGERYMIQPQVINFVAKGDRRMGQELSRQNEYHGLWAVDKEDTVLIGYRARKHSA